MFVKIILIFITVLLFNNSLLNRLFEKNINITKTNLINLQSDFLNIGFPIEFEIGTIFISIVISLMVTLLVNYFIVSSIDFQNPISVIKNIVNIFFIYSGALLSILYFLRMFNFSRGILLIYLFLFPILLFILLLINNYLATVTSNILKYGLIMFLFFTASFYLFSQIRTTSNVSISSDEEEIPFLDIGINNSENCAIWDGSDNYTDCVTGLIVIEAENFSQSLNNVIVYKDKIYILDVFGKIFRNQKSDLFLDISKSVLNRVDSSGESGLFGLAFHPNENYFLVSYSDLENNLTVEKFYLDSDMNPLLDTSKIVLRIPNSINAHYSGSIIWSNYFNDFLLSVGDMEGIEAPYANSEPLSTSSPRGKILFLNKNISNPDLLAESKNSSFRKDILAFGLRNPWKTIEYKNLLIIPDVGFSTEEELNIVNLDEFKDTKKPYLFGWPHFEGTIENTIKFNEILLFENNLGTSINTYVLENSIKPIIFYKHQAPENFRAAIIGGGVITDVNSKYYEHYIFADYLSNELFAYDFINNKLKILPFGDFGAFITSLTIHPNKFDIVLATTGTGNLLQIQLP